MKLAIFLFIMIFLLIVTFSYRRRLHLFEMMFIWMMVWVITHSVSSIIIENLELVSISQRLDEFWLHVFKRLILYPLIIILFIDFYVRVKSKSKKMATLGLNLLVMVLLERLFIILGVLFSHHFMIWMSVLEWSFTLLITYLSWYWYRKKYISR
nr:hypothetical protein [Neobacillus sp. Marseille-Q6967]